jgi:hypothetical protein
MHNADSRDIDQRDLALEILAEQFAPAFNSSSRADFGSISGCRPAASYFCPSRKAWRIQMKQFASGASGLDPTRYGSFTMK